MRVFFRVAEFEKQPVDYHDSQSCPNVCLPAFSLVLLDSSVTLH